MKSFLISALYFLLLNLPSDLWGQFAPPQVFDDVSTLDAKQINFADLDGDGDQDIVIGGQSQRVWYPNDGNGVYQAPIVLPAAFGLSSFDIGDLDNDGDQDIIMINNEDIAWQRNEGGGIFSDTMRCVTSVWFTYLDGHSIQILDFDNDGRMDFVYKHDDYSHVVKNTGAADFPTVLTEFHQLAAYNYTNVYGDINGDGYPDKLSSENLSFVVQAQYNGAGEFIPDSLATVASYPNTIVVADLVADVNNDGFGNPIYGVGDRTAVAYQINGSGSFFTTEIQHEQRLKVANAADIDGDGQQDLLAYQWVENGSLSPEIRYFPNLGDYEFGSVQLLDDSDRVAPKFFDVNDDGKPDILAVNEGQLLWFENIADDPALVLNFFQDENANGVQDEGERAVSDIAVDLLAPAETYYSNDDGQIILRLPAGEYEYEITDPTCWSLPEGTPNTVSYTWSASMNDTLHYALQLEGGNDGELSGNLVSALTRCSNEVRFDLVLNVDCSTTEGVVALVLDENVSFVAAVYPPDLIEGNTLWWNFADVLSGGRTQWPIILQMPDAEATGDTLRFQWYAYGANCENDPEIAAPTSALSTGLNVCQTGTYAPIVRCSYDPNDKQVIPYRGEEHNYTLFEETLRYTVRFQNTGNDTAFVVEIRDTLSSDLAWNTLNVTGGSHPYEVLLDRDNGALSFTFNDIFLVDSTTNEPASHGFVHFTIESRTGLPENTLVDNRASIYFDANPPILTNTVTSELVSVLPMAPEAAFSYSAAGGTVTFQDESLNEPLTWLWDFADGATSTLANPTHTYTEGGDYEVCLTTSNDQGADMVCESISVMITAWQDLTNSFDFTIVPNPADELARIRWDGTLPAGSYLQVYDLLGRAVSERIPVAQRRQVELNLSGYTVGTYHVQLFVDGRLAAKGSLVKR